VRAVIDAYADGRIELPAVPKNAPGVLHAPSVLKTEVDAGEGQLRYTRTSVALFLGWTKKHNDRIVPNYACTQSFAALELIERELLKESDFRGRF